MKATTHYGLFYEHWRDLDVHGYTDVDWAGSDKRSTSGYAFTLRSVVVTWSKQPIIALFSTKAKYRGATMAACDVMWSKKMLKDLGEHHDGKVVRFCDNMSSI